jgi:hypothetical protein
MPADPTNFSLDDNAAKLKGPSGQIILCFLLRYEDLLAIIRIIADFETGCFFCHRRDFFPGRPEPAVESAGQRR